MKLLSPIDSRELLIIQRINSLNIKEPLHSRSSLSPPPPIVANETKRKEMTVVLVYPFTEYGLLCNNIHQIAAAIDLALAFPKIDQVNTKVILAFESKMGILVKQALDEDFLVKMGKISAELKFPNLNPLFSLHNIDIWFNWRIGRHPSGFKLIMLNPKKFQQKYGDQFSFALTFFVRPSFKLREIGNKLLDEFTLKNPRTSLVSIHRRMFAWCSATYKKYTPFCGDIKSNLDWRAVQYYEDDCNVTFTNVLYQQMQKEWKGLNELENAEPVNNKDNNSPRSFAFFLATDLHDKAGDSTFSDQIYTISIPHQENEEHVIAEQLIQDRKTNKSMKGFLKNIVKERTGLDMNWDVSMLVDMHAQQQAVFSLGAPWSSCDRILAMWKSKYTRASHFVFDNRINVKDDISAKDIIEKVKDIENIERGHLRMFPASCYQLFESPTEEEGIRVSSGMRNWWTTHVLHLLSTEKLYYEFPTQSYSIIPAVSLDI